MTGGTEKDNINEPAAANTELEHSGCKQVNGTMFLVGSAVTVLICFMWCFDTFMRQQKFEKIGKSQI